MPKTPAKKNRTVAKSAADSIPAHAPPKLAAAARQSQQGPEPGAEPPPATIYCTIAAAHELPQALLLRDSLQAASGAVDFRLLLLEQPAVVARLRAELPELPAAAILGPDEVCCPQWLAMAFYYDLREYAEALKPALLRTLLRQGCVVYLDPDIEVLAPLTGLTQLMWEADVVVAPEYTALAEEGGDCNGGGLEAAGLHLGCIGVRPGAAAEGLLAQLQEQLIEGGRQSPEQALSPEQLWVAALLTAAPRVETLRSRQYSLAAGNVGPDELTFTAPAVAQTPDGPLCLLHPAPGKRHETAAFTPGDPRSSPGSAPCPALASLLAEHRRKLARSPHKRFAGVPYSFGSYEGGAPIPAPHRRALWLVPAVNRRTVANPFAERPLITKLADQLAAAPDPEPAGQPARQGRLSFALLGSAGKRAGDLFDRALPGGRERLAGALYAAAAHRDSIRYYAGEALDKILPGSRDRFFAVVQAAATSPRPAIRHTAALLLRAAGDRS